MKRFLLLFLLLGCSHLYNSFVYTNRPYVDHGRVIHIWVDTDFGEADKVAIDHALVQWNYALNGNLTLVYGKDDWVFLKVGANIEPGVLAFTGPAEIYFVRERIRNSQMTGLTIYNIGQLLGARDFEGEVEDYHCVDYNIIQGVAQAQGIPLGQLNYCVYKD